MGKKPKSKERSEGWLPRFFRPSMRLYFAVLVVFGVAALALRYWELGAAELLAALLLLL